MDTVSHIETETDAQTLRIRIRGEIDHHTAKGVREEIDRVFLSVRPAVLLLDLSLVDFMDSSGLGLILGRYTLATDNGARFALYNPNAGVRKIIDLAGLERIVTVCGGETK